ncbi:Biotin/lipoate A/B protein ligase [Chytridiales sp. JEL 0842]|nr:Biotin/lipoate A/B protein ligase [Chytridiales sp. JEL 0842]
MPRAHFSRTKHAHLVSLALENLDIPSKVNARHDIVIPTPTGQDLKVSGSAYKVVRGKAYHHGTMLISSDLKGLGTYLKSSPRTIEGRGIASVRSPVSKLSDHSFTVTHTDFCHSVANQFGKLYKTPAALSLFEISERMMEGDRGLQGYMDEFKSWEWTYGQTPEFRHTLTRQFEFGDVTATLKVSQGLISELDIMSTSNPSVAAEVGLLANSELVGLRYDDGNPISRTIGEELEGDVKEVWEWIANEIECI